MSKQGNAHISLHITNKNPRGTLVVQPRNADGTFRSPVPASKGIGTSFHSADYTMTALPEVIRGRLTR